MRVAFASAELVPFSKTGGLGDVSAALAGELHRSGCDVRLFTPFYSTIETADHEFHPVSFLQDVPLALGTPETGPVELTFSVFTVALPGSGGEGHDPLGVYLLHCPALYQRSSIYTGEAEEPLRFAFLARAALECCQRMGWSPQIFHAHDWHTGLAPLYLKALYRWDELFADTRTVLTIHNIGYQGEFGAEWVAPLGLAEHAGLLHQERLAAGRINFLETAILWADAVTTVSPTHAREIQRPEYGFGLDALLRERSDSLVGILNGIDSGVWNPSVDEHLPVKYSARSLAGKTKNKRHLLESLELPFEKTTPLVGIVSRLTSQKGFDYALPALAEALERGDIQLVALGTGEPDLEGAFRSLAEEYPDRARFLSLYSEEWAHRVEAAADLFLMPSRYEPCGLNQMYSLAYGTVPIVRRTGGLADTVIPWDADTQTGNGFVFDHADTNAVRWALGRALDTWKEPRQWRRLRQNAMAEDHSWARRGGEYLRVYRGLVG